jgi:DNA primase
VATCGTAFGAEHIKVARRLLSDDGSGGEVIFTFDGDAAGQKAALRAFEEDQRFVAQTYVAVEPSGADPCDLRQLKGDDAVRELIGTRRPLFEFAIRATLKRHDLDTVEGRIAALREAAPVIARIRDSAMRPAYARALSGWLGMPMEDVDRAVGAAVKRGGAAAASAAAPPDAQSIDAGRHGAGAAVAPGPVFLRPDPNDPVAAMERQALEVVLQEPGSLEGAGWDRFAAVQFTVPAYGAVHTAVRATGPGRAADPVSWVEHIRQEVPEPLRPLVSQLAVVPLPASTPEAMQRYCRDILARLFELQITRVKADKMGQLQRLDPAAQPDDFQRLNRELMELEMQRRALRADS